MGCKILHMIESNFAKQEIFSKIEKENNMKSYFITGGEGFVGHHLAKQLLSKGENKVISYDAQKHHIEMAKSNWTFYIQKRLEGLQNENLIRVRGDVTNRGFLKETLEKHKPDIIIHLAALPIANVSNKYPDEARRDILDASITILDVIKDLSFDLERFVYTSSSMVYGDFQRDAQGQVVAAIENQHCSPVGIYGAMKLSGEHLTRAYNRRFGIPYTIIRPSAVYGPTDCNRRVTEIFIMKALRGEPLRLDNGGLHELDFTYVKDLVNGFILSSNSENALNQTFNLTRGEGRQIKDLADVLSDLIPETKSYVDNVTVFRPNRGALNISKARDLLGYAPKYSLEEGMKEYLEYIRNSGILKD